MKTLLPGGIIFGLILAFLATWPMIRNQLRFKPEIQLVVLLEADYFTVDIYVFDSDKYLHSEKYLENVMENHKKRERGEGKLEYEIGIKNEIVKHMLPDKRTLIELWGDDKAVNETIENLGSIKDLPNVKISKPLQTSVRLITNGK